VIETRHLPFLLSRRDVGDIKNRGATASCTDEGNSMEDASQAGHRQGNLRWSPGAGWLFMGADVISGGWQCGPCDHGQPMAYKLSEPSENYCR